MGSSIFGRGGGQQQPMFIPPPPPPPAANPPTFADSKVQAAGRIGTATAPRGAGFAGTDQSSGAAAVTGTPNAKQTLGGG